MIIVMTMFSPLKTCLCSFNMCRAFLVTVPTPVRFSSRVLNKEEQISQMESGNFSNPEKFPSVYLPQPHDDIVNCFFLVLRCFVL